MFARMWDSQNCGKPDELSTLTKNRNGAVVFLLPWPSSGKALSTKRSGMLESGPEKKIILTSPVKTLSLNFWVQTEKYHVQIQQYKTIGKVLAN